MILKSIKFSLRYFPGRQFHLSHLCMKVLTTSPHFFALPRLEHLSPVTTIEVDKMINVSIKKNQQRPQKPYPMFECQGFVQEFPSEDKKLHLSLEAFPSSRNSLLLHWHEQRKIGDNFLTRRLSKI
eukprot:995876_1